MATAQKIDGIQFNRIISEGGYPLPGAPLRWTGPEGQYWYGVENSSGGVINAIDIDWNDAVVNSKHTLQNSADFFNLLKEINTRLTALESAKIPASFTVTPKEITLYTNGVQTQQITTKITYK
jgi:hypothetical protein